VPFDGLQILQKQTLSSYDCCESFSDFNDLYNKYIKDLNKMVEKIYLDRAKIFKTCGVSNKDWVWEKQMPCTIVSLFEQGCIEKGLSYLEGGPLYNIISPHIGGFADVVNSLYAIKKLVFDDKKLTFSAFMSILKNNWANEEVLRQYVLNHYDYYGNDNDEVDEIASRLLSDYADICISFNGKCGYRFPAGVSTFGRQIEWAPYRFASAHGRKQGEILSANTCASHSFEWVVTTPAAAGVKGEESYMCNHCKEVKETREIPALEPEYPIGDADFNNKVDATDARLALRAAVGLDKLTEAVLKAADVDKDGDVDATDARLILRAAVGLETLK
jgi:hypothetical protein